MCDCIEKIEAELTAVMEKKTGKEVAEPVRLSPQFLYSESYPLHFTAAGKVHHGHRTRKIEVNVILTYCPFCGTKVKFKE